MSTSRLVLVTVVVCLVGCAGGMPRDAARSSYATRLAAQKNRYYITLRDGALSRVLAIQPESVAWRELSAMATQWEAIRAASRAEALLALLEAKGLSALTIRLRQALSSTVNRRPRPLDAELEAAALKQALLEAYRRLEKEG